MAQSATKLGDPRWPQIPFITCLAISWVSNMISLIISALEPLSSHTSHDIFEDPVNYVAGVVYIVLSGLSLFLDITITIFYLLKHLSPLLISFLTSPLTIAWLALIFFFWAVM